MFDFKRVAGLTAGALLASALSAQAAIVLTADTTLIDVGNAGVFAPTTSTGDVRLNFVDDELDARINLATSTGM